MHVYDRKVGFLCGGGVGGVRNREASVLYLEVAVPLEEAGHLLVVVESAIEVPLQAGVGALLAQQLALLDLLCALELPALLRLLEGLHRHVVHEGRVRRDVQRRVACSAEIRLGLSLSPMRRGRVLSSLFSGIVSE